MRKIIRVSILTKFIIAMVSLSALPVIIIGWQLIEINRKGLQGTILELHTLLASSLADKVNDYLSSLENRMLFVIKSITIAKGQSQGVLQALLDSDEDFVSISLVNRRGKEIFKVYDEELDKNPVLLDHSSNETFKKIRKYDDRQASLLGPVFFSGQTPRIHALFKISEEHLIFATISLTNLWKHIENVQLGKTGYAFMVNAQGRLIAHPDIALAQKQIDMKNLSIVREALKAVSFGSQEYRLPDKTTIIGAYAPIRSLGWGIIVAQNKSEAFITEILSRRQATRIGALVILFAGIIAYLMARGLSRPIMRLIYGAERVASGDFTTQVHVHTRDELHDLAKTFNSMTHKLKAYADLQVDKIIAEKTKTEAIIFSIADGIIMTDHEGTIQLINDQALKMFDIPSQGGNYEGKTIYDLVPENSLNKTLKELITQSQSNDFREIDLSKEDVARFYKLNAGKVTALKGDDLGTVTVVHDITLEKQLDNMKEEFLHSITHDLRNPMTSIKGFLKFLIDGVPGEVNPQQKKMLLTINKASDKLLIMINDILDIAKIEAGQLDLDLESVNVPEVASHVIEVAEGLAQRRHISLELKADDAIGPISADNRLIERVMTNLISNSIKFSPEDGTITLEIVDDDSHIKVSVIDHGDGIPADYIDKIFDKFKQVAGQRKGGTGLGLTICKHVVELHKGTIWVESKRGEGSQFIFRIPKNLKQSEDGTVICT